MAFQVSPGVAISEVDLSTTIPTASVSDAGFVGFFTKGPCNKIVNIGSENELVETFGKPVSGNAADWLTVASFLAYGGSIQVVRQSDGSARNAGNGAAGVYIPTQEYFETAATGDIPANAVYARTAGSWGNGLKVLVFDKDHESDDVGGGYNLPVIDNETDIHVLVELDGSIVESFEWLSVTSGSKDASGNNNFYADVINQQSAYIYAGSTSISVEDNTGDGYNSISLAHGSDELGPAKKDYDLFLDTDQVDLALIVTGISTDTITNNDESIELATSRKDCVAFVSPPLADVVGNKTLAAKAEDVVEARNDISTPNSYGFMDSGWKKMYDKYNDTWVQVPLNGDMAGLCVATDQNREPWYSPAGFNRGQIRNCAGLLFDPNQTSRDTLYKNNVNPVSSFPGEGYVLFGDKTLQAKPSAFDRINVRRLFIVLEKAIANAAKYSLFEFNDEFTRAQFRSIVDPFLSNIKSRRGVYDYLVVCDNSNNTPDVIDRNEFIGDIFIKPARSINFIQLNFVAVKTGVSFQEIIGAV